MFSEPGLSPGCGRRALAVLSVAPANGRAATESRPALPAAPLMAYLESWWDNAATMPAAMRLAHPPAHLDIMALAFARPEMRYPGGLDLRQSGLEFAAPGPVLRDAVALARLANPGLRILLSLGGATYHAGWARLDAGHVARLVADLGLDGVDIDLEPRAPGCGPGADGRVSCNSDTLYISAINALRAALPRPALLTLCGWSTGGFGEGEYRAAPPGGAWMGTMIGVLRSPAAAQLDAVNLMAYDAGAHFSVAQAATAYRALWPGLLMIGIAVPGAQATRPRATLAHARHVGAVARTFQPAGVFVYGMLSPSLGPDARALLGAAAAGLRDAPRGVVHAR